MTPVDAALLKGDATALELPRELRMDGEAVGNAQQLLGELGETVRANGRRHLRGRRARNLAVVLVLPRTAERRLQSLVCGPQHRLDLGDEGLGLLAGQHALGDQLLLVEL